MLCKEVNSEELHFFIKEVLASLRDTNKRIDELNWVRHLESCDEQTKVSVAERLKKLHDSRSKLISSIDSVKMHFREAFGDDQYRRIFGSESLHKELQEL